MASPGGIVLERHLRLRGRRHASLVRPGSLAPRAVVPVLSLLNVFGQRPESVHARSAAADLDVYSPSRLRGGLLFTTRFTPSARRMLRHPTLVLDPGWIEAENLTRERLTFDEIRAEARLQNIATLGDAEWAILETSGKISFIPKSG